MEKKSITNHPRHQAREGVDMAANRHSNLVKDEYRNQLVNFTKMDLIELVWDYAKASLGDESLPDTDVMGEIHKRNNTLEHYR